MSENTVLSLLPFIIPGGVIALWLLVTSIIGIAAGWFRLRRAYPSDDLPTAVVLRGQSAEMGAGARFTGVLTLAGGRDGISVSVARLLGPFQRPILIPWRDITAERRKLMIGGKAVRLSIGKPEIGTITIHDQAWDQLTRHSPVPTPAHALPSVVDRVSINRLVRTGLILAGAAGTAFYAIPRLLTQEGPPLIAAFLLPAIAIGGWMTLHYLRRPQ